MSLTSPPTEQTDAAPPAPAPHSFAIRVFGKLGASRTLFCHKSRAWSLDYLQSSAAYIHT